MRRGAGQGAANREQEAEQEAEPCAAERRGYSAVGEGWSLGKGKGRGSGDKWRCNTEGAEQRRGRVAADWRKLERKRGGRQQLTNECQTFVGDFCIFLTGPPSLALLAQHLLGDAIVEKHQIVPVSMRAAAWCSS